MWCCKMVCIYRRVSIKNRNQKRNFLIVSCTQVCFFVSSLSKSVGSVQKRSSVSSVCISCPSRPGCSLQASLGLQGLPPCGRIPDRTQTHTAVAQGPSLLPENDTQNSPERYLSATVSDYVCVSTLSLCLCVTFSLQPAGIQGPFSN